MKTRCKFSCQRVAHIIHGGKIAGVEVLLYPVYSSDPNSENKQFWDATPSGEMRLHITKPEAANWFESGKEYYVDIAPAEQTG